VFVHIADVSAFVVAGGPIDEEASWRGWLRVSARPGGADAAHALSSSACSLQPGVDRYAVTIEVAPTVRRRPTASTIRSDHRLSYPQVERMLAGHEPAADDCWRRCGTRATVRPAAGRTLHTRGRAHRLP
jgi:ribonuclease R